MMPDLVFAPLTTAGDCGPDVAAQTSMALALLDTHLQAAGSSLKDAVATTVYLRDANDFARMNAAYRDAWSGTLPTRTTIVAAPDRGALVGISAVGVRVGGERTAFHPDGWLPSANPYSFAIGTGNTVFLSGLLARSGRDRAVMGSTIEEQTRAIFANARELLAAAELTLSDVVSARVFLPDLRDFTAMNDVYGEFFPSDPPTRATVGAALTAPPYKIEVTFIARRGSRQVVDDEELRFRNLSAAIRSGDYLCVSGALGVSDRSREHAGLQARETLSHIERALHTAGFVRDDVRDLLAYVIDASDADAVVQECRAFAPHAAISAPVVTLADADGKVEIVTTALHGR